jgi:hypothetical protein
MKTTVLKSRIVLLAMMGLWAASMNGLAQGDFAGGSGTEGDPYQVSTLEQLQAVKDHLESHFIQVADIDATDTKNWNDGAGFEPIKSFTGTFTGSYDGDEHVISNLFISLADSLEVGLFGASAGLIKNVTLENVDILGDNLTGGIVGYNVGEVEYCVSSGVVNGGRRVGGLVGQNDEGGLIKNSNSSCDVTAGRDAGGLVGGNPGTIRNCWASGNAMTMNSDKPHDCGGLAGSTKGGAIYNSYATGSVTAEGQRAGGLTGNLQNDGAYVENCWASGTVQAGGIYSGGLIGRSRNAITVKTSYSTGAVFNTLDTEYMGGLTGQVDESVTYVDTYWDKESSGVSNGVGEGDELNSNALDNITGLTTAEMTGEAAEQNMTGFDFENIWEVSEGYPVFIPEAVTALENVSAGHDNILIYPNPATDYLTVEIKDLNKYASISVLDIAGKLMYKDDFSASENRSRLDLSEYCSGIYFIRVQIEDKVSTRKVILND